MSVTVWEQQVDDVVYAAIVGAADSYGVPRNWMLAICKFESGFRPDALNDKGEYSVGLFQLNMQGGVGTGYTEEQLKNPVLNSEIAAKKMATEYRIKGNWLDAADAWTTRFKAWQWLKDRGEEVGNDRQPTVPGVAAPGVPTPSIFSEDFFTQKPVIITIFIAILLVGVLSLNSGRQYQY